MEENTYFVSEPAAEGAPDMPPETAPDSSAARARKCVSRVGLALFAMMAAQYAATLLLSFVLGKMKDVPGLEDWSMLLMGIVPLYLFGLPVLLAVMRGLPAEPPQKQPTQRLLLRSAPVCMFFTYAGSIAGTLLMSWINALLPRPVSNGVSDYVMGEFGWKAIFLTVVVAPVMEELVFRRLLINRLHMYGQRMAIFVSALAFGLYHGNFYQFFYALLLGLVFGYVYVRTGKLWHTMALHAGVNFIGSVISVKLLERFTENVNAPEEIVKNMQSVLLLGAFAMAMLGAAIAGLTILIKRRREIRLEPTPADGVTAGRALLTPGMLLFIIAACGSFALYMLSYQMR